MKKLFKLTALVLVGLLASCGNAGESATDAAAGNAADAAYDNIMTRVSVRDYEARSVGRDTVELILKAAMQAPSAMKKFPRKYVVVEGAALDSLRAEFPNAAHSEGMKKAPLAIVVCGDMSRLDKDEAAAGDGFWVQDCSAAAENILLSAHALGLGSCWTGVWPAPGRSADMARLLSLPESLRPLCAILIGYPGKDVAEAEPRWNPDDVIWMK